jgi:hypothetical protein
MPTEINGLPAHVLLVHVVIVLLPLAAAMLVVSAVWPLMRRKLGVLTPAVALVALIFVPITVSAGRWLRDHLNGGLAQTPLVQKHTHLGTSLLPWAVGIFVVSAAVWWVGRQYGLEWKQSPRSTDSNATGAGSAVATRERTRTSLPTWVTAVVAVVSIAVAVGGSYQLYRIGDSGAKAVWTGNFSQTSTANQGGNR